MEIRQEPLSSSPAPIPLEELILPSQVWIHLAKDQQHRLLQTIVLVCQELVSTLLRPQESEVSDE
jgi:hypothetical protein